MRTTYRVLALLVCALVGLQPPATCGALPAWASGWTRAACSTRHRQGHQRLRAPWPELTGLLLHGMSGMFVIPTVALLLRHRGLVARFPGTVPRACSCFTLVVAQVTASACLGHTYPLTRVRPRHTDCCCSRPRTPAQRHERVRPPPRSRSPRWPVPSAGPGRPGRACPAARDGGGDLGVGSGLAPGSYAVTSIGRPDTSSGESDTERARAPARSGAPRPPRPPLRARPTPGRPGGLGGRCAPTAPARPNVRVELQPPARAPVRSRTAGGGQRLHAQRHLPGPTIEASPANWSRCGWSTSRVPGRDHAPLARHGRAQRGGRRRRSTQDAVAPGRSTSTVSGRGGGTYWYHSHQVSHEQVQRGLLGASSSIPGMLPPTARQPRPGGPGAPYDGVRTVNGQAGAPRVPVSSWHPGPGPRDQLRHRTDERHGRVGHHALPGRGRGRHRRQRPRPSRTRPGCVTAAARADLEVVLPERRFGVRVEPGGSAAIVLGPSDAPEPTATLARATVDLLTYGSPGSAGPVAGQPDRELRLHNRATASASSTVVPVCTGPSTAHLYPDVPMFMVATGESVRDADHQRRGDVHPMHLHGHHAVVLTRNGVASLGQPMGRRLAEPWQRARPTRSGSSRTIPGISDGPLPQPRPR